MQKVVFLMLVVWVMVLITTTRTTEALLLISHYNALYERLSLLSTSQTTTTTTTRGCEIFAFEEIQTLKEFHIYSKLKDLSDRTNAYMLDKFLLMHKKKKNHHYYPTNLEFFVSSNHGINNDEFCFNAICTGSLMHDTQYVLSAYYLTEKNAKMLGEHFCFLLNMQQMENILYPARHVFSSSSSSSSSPSKEEEVATGEDLFFEVNSLNIHYNDDIWQKLMQYRFVEI